MNLQTGEVPTVQPNPSESLMSRMGRRAIQIAPRLAVAVGLTLAADSALLAPVAHADQLVSASGYDVDVYCNYVDNLTEIDIDKTQGSAAIEAAGTLTVGSEVIPLGHVTSGVLQHFKIPTQHDNETITLDITTPQKVHTSFQSGCRINDTKPVPKKSGYWLSSNDGGIYPFGTAPQLGPGKRGTIKVEKTPSGYGYYTLTPDGRVMGHGDAPLYGDRPAL